MKEMIGVGIEEQRCSEVWKRKEKEEKKTEKITLYER